MPIVFNFQTSFSFSNRKPIRSWIQNSIIHMGKTPGEINYVFCTNAYILEINKKFLNHDYTTDIITFDYSEQSLINGEIYISIDEVKENAKHFKVSFQDELHRVLIHGILHLAGFKDKSTSEMKLMRSQEDYYLSLRTF